MSYTLHPAAEAELAHAANYYAIKASRRIGAAFLDEFERVATMVDRNQQLGKVTREGLRILSFLRFPYSIIYREAAAGPIIYAVSHQKREPGYWQDRR